MVILRISPAVWCVGFPLGAGWVQQICMCWQGFAALRAMGASEVEASLGDESWNLESWNVLQERWRFRK